MSVEIMFRAVSNSHAAGVDDLKDRACYKRGDPIIAKDSPWQWSTAELSSRFLSITITDATLAQVKGYLSGYRQEIDYVVEANDPVQDEWTLNFSVQNPPVSGGLSLTAGQKAQIQECLLNWNATIETVAPTSVTIKVLIRNAIKSKGFWKTRDFDGITASETDYDQVSGIHTFSVDYSAADAKSSYLQHRVERNGGTVVSHNPANKTAIVTISRNNVFAAFKKQADKYCDSHFIRRKKFYLPEAAVSWIEANGRHYVEMTKAQVIAQIRNKQDE
ncbi:MAG: hypothetical protein ACXABY_11325 [Candidatus Thorarchaeota archaeon]|jgi:hypothetical protein